MLGHVLQRPTQRVDHLKAELFLLERANGELCFTGRLEICTVFYIPKNFNNHAPLNVLKPFLDGRHCVTKR